MASISLTLNKNYQSKKGTYPLCLELCHKEKTRFIPINKIHLKESQWVLDKKKGTMKIVDFPNAERKSNEAFALYSEANTFILNNENLINTLNINQLKSLLIEKVIKEAEEGEAAPKLRSAYLEVFSKKLIDELNSLNDPSAVKTGIWYRDSVRAFKKFNKGEDIQMIDIGSETLEDYKRYCYKMKFKINSINNYMRGLRAIMNKARAIGPPVLDKNHRPFEDVKIPSQEANKRAMDQEGITLLRSLILEEGSVEWHQLNYALFMFNNQGMNFVDLAHLKVHQLTNGRLRYIRSKTKRSRNPKEFDIKQTEESLKILSYYLPNKEPDDFVFPILSKELVNDAVQLVKVRDQALKVHNDTMKKLAKDNGLTEKPTSYVFRHSWANIAKKNGVSTEKIKDALGQGNVIVTETYLENFDKEVLDELNEMVTSLGGNQKMKTKLNDLEWILKLLSDAGLSPNNPNFKELFLGIILRGLNKEFS